MKFDQTMDDTLFDKVTDRVLDILWVRKDTYVKRESIKNHLVESKTIDLKNIETLWKIAFDGGLDHAVSYAIQKLKKTHFIVGKVPLGYCLVSPNNPDTPNKWWNYWLDIRGFREEIPKSEKETMFERLQKCHELCTDSSVRNELAKVIITIKAEQQDKV